MDIRLFVRSCQQRRPSRISTHKDAECCRIAKAWFLAMDLTLGAGVGLIAPPTWIRKRYEWGPTAWPLYWCDAVHSGELDCGALNALSMEALSARGVAVTAIQLVQEFSQSASLHWRRRWESAGRWDGWARGQYAYHEACAILDGPRLDVWDPTDNAWIEPSASRGYSAVNACRLPFLTTRESVEWRGRRLNPRRWTILTDARGGPSSETRRRSLDA